MRVAFADLIFADEAEDLRLDLRVGGGGETKTAMSIVPARREEAEEEEEILPPDGMGRPGRATL